MKKDILPSPWAPMFSLLPRTVNLLGHQAAMYYNGSWLPNEVAEITGDDFQWGAMFFPAPEGSKYRTRLTPQAASSTV